MSLHKGDKLLKVRGTARDVLDRFVTWTSQHETELIPDGLIASLLAPDEAHVEFEVLEGGEYTPLFEASGVRDVALKVVR